MRRRESYIEKEMLTCRHFTGLMHDACDAGVTYADVKDTSTRPVGLPCLSSDGCTTSCPKAQYPTREEAEAAEQRLEDTITRIGRIREAIVEHTGGKRGIAGTLPCPCCDGGTIRFSVSGYNGHIHARCSTEACAEWME